MPPAMGPAQYICTNGRFRACSVEPSKDTGLVVPGVEFKDTDLAIPLAEPLLSTGADHRRAGDLAYLQIMVLAYEVVIFHACDQPGSAAWC